MTGTDIPQAFEQAKISLSLQINPLRRILVVEDEPDIRRINAVALHHAGYHVDTAEDGIAGWKALHAVRHAPESYNLLITDHQMPGMTGLNLVKNMRAARMALPVIMASGTPATEDLFIRYPWMHPAVMLVKPYSIEQLLETVEKMLCATASPGDEMAPPTGWPVPPPDDVLTL
jgi:DNA-binding response OmpR family regulator